MKLRTIALIPWFLIFKAIRMDKFDKHYDYKSFSGFCEGPATRRSLVLGWAFWFLVLAVVAVLIWRNL